MLEIAMCLCLTLMGIYFIKSTDLPKDLKERSTRENSETKNFSNANRSKTTFPKDTSKKLQLEINDLKLAEINQIRKTAILNKNLEEIDKLTLIITSLEQELKVNNQRNNEIQKLIDLNVAKLEIIQEKTNQLT